MFVSRYLEKKRSSRKALSFSLPKVQKITCRNYRGWNYEICFRRIGITVIRDQFSASLWRGFRAFSEYLPSFRTEYEARAAVTKRIDYIEDVLKGRIVRRETDGSITIHEAHQPFAANQSEELHSKIINLLEQEGQEKIER